MINRSWENDTAIELDASAFEGYRFVEQLELFSEDMDAKNTYEAPDTILPVKSSAAKAQGGVVTSTVKKLSWNVFRFEK